MSQSTALDACDDVLQVICAHVILGQERERDAYKAGLPKQRSNMLMDLINVLGTDLDAELAANPELQARYKECRATVGAFITTCKHFYATFKSLEQQVASGMRAAAGQTTTHAAEMILRSDSGLRLNYKRIFVFVDADTSPPEVHLHAAKHHPRAVPTGPTQRLKSNISRQSQCGSQEDLYVTDLPATADNTPPTAFITRQYSPNAFLGGERPFHTYLPDDLYEVWADGALPRFHWLTGFHWLPDCMDDVLAQDAIIVGGSAHGCWYEATGDVKIELRPNPEMMMAQGEGFVTAYNGRCVVQ